MMMTAALVTADSRQRFEIQKWMKELAEQVKLESFSSLEEFIAVAGVQALDMPDPGKEPANEATEASAETEASGGVVDLEDIGSGKAEGPSRYYRLLIVDLDLVIQSQQRPLPWAAKTRKLLEDMGRSDPKHPVRLMYISFETSQYTPESLRHEAVDDLVMRPIDRTLFLQKVECLTAPEHVQKPSFLFRQTVSFPIEAGKDAMIDEIAEFAVAVRNPSPLSDGVFAAIHSEVFGAGDASRVIGRVYRSDPHPIHEGEYLVRFSFFGISSEQFEHVRKYIRQHRVPVRAKQEERSLPRASARSSTEALRRVAVIEGDQSTYMEIKSTLEEAFVGLQVKVFPSYTRFLTALNRLQNASLHMRENALLLAAPNPALIGEPAFPGGRPLALIFDAHSRTFSQFRDNFRDSDLLLGRAYAKWKTQPQEILSAIEPEDRSELEELIDYTCSGANAQAFVRMRADGGKIIYLAVTGSLESLDKDEDSKFARIDFRQLDANQWQAVAGSDDKKGLLRLDPKEFKFDAMYIDSALVQSDPKIWLTGLQELFIKGGTLSHGDPIPKIFMLGAAKASEVPQRMRARGVTDFMRRPLERKTLVQKAHALMPQWTLTRQVEQPSFVECEIPAKLAKDVKLEEISEFGLAISHPTPFREKVFMRFFHPLFGDGHEGVIGRCTHCEKITAQAGGTPSKGANGVNQESYICHFTFFGTKDDLLMQIRTWIREDYVHRKDPSSS